MDLEARVPTAEEKLLRNDNFYCCLKVFTAIQAILLVGTMAAGLWVLYERG